MALGEDKDVRSAAISGCDLSISPISDKVSYFMFSLSVTVTLKYKQHTECTYQFRIKQI